MHGHVCVMLFAILMKLLLTDESENCFCKTNAIFTRVMWGAQYWCIVVNVFDIGASVHWF